MTWIRFALWLLGIYTAYYACLIFWDNIRTKKASRNEAQHELSFVEDVQPAKAEFAAPPAADKPVASSGGVSLKQLFNLAREESVEYIKAVSF